MQPSYEYQVQFLQNIQRILKEGVFTSTYKFALLHSIADYCIEQGNDDDSELIVPIKELASKFISLYWSQTSKFPNDSESDVLYQNRGKQSAIINYILNAKQIDPKLSKIQSHTHYSKLLTNVTSVIKDMPLWKLQVVGDSVFDFIYPQIDTGDDITLKQGVSYCFRRFHGQIIDMLQSAWIRWIQKASKNQIILGQNINLEDFLFESRRISLKAYVPILKEDQDNNCFYCKKQMRSLSEVDHFIPWSRYSVDLGHNFVLAHKACNGDKKDYLASEEYLERWYQRNIDSNVMLTEYFDDHQLPHDLNTSIAVSKWAYKQHTDASGVVWLGYQKGLSVVSDGWSRMLTSEL